LWLSGSTDVVGWLDTKLYDETGDEQAAQGWCPTIVDTSGDGAIGEYTEPGEPLEAGKDMRLDGFAYGIIPNPVDGSIWIARRLPVPGSIVRLDLGDNPPETCSAEVYEPPFENPDVDPSQWGHGGRGIDVDRNGVLWTALGGSGHLASFDRSKCAVLNGPTATGQHCPEGWTLYPTPGPQMKGVTAAGSADFHYYNWVDQFDTLGLGANVPIANGTSSDALLALLPETGEWVTLRVPYPLGFYTRGLDGRIDDREAGWKGRGVWASYDSVTNWHQEGGKGMTSEIVRFQIRPHPLAE
ncbi:MAG: carboxypeptidase regulatory-like domain-containing protein, partial [Acidobacteriota bacterium]|nr:carboxypeptidase regulatory-like domain-containing protein [Acidobacteriota bacterium]